ncbi:alpha/beta hydrolase [Candidatus Halobeggiatoa sp. HSG11]|nr:alpha/beta hydrolase [Candidatus Halobeggiatoa sp. HSG11]
MKQHLILLLFLLLCQAAFGADNDKSDTLCYPQQTTSPPLGDHPICDRTPTERATFDADTGKVILPAVRINQTNGYLYSLELSLLSAADAPILNFEMTNYCLIQEPISLPSSVDIATLTLPPGQIHIPAIDIEGITYSADLDVEQPSTQVWEENEIFTRKKEQVTFKVLRREIRENTEKPKYPVLFVHGLNSDGETWKNYYDSGWISKGLTYGGNIYIRDKYHLFEPGDNANQNPDDSNLRRQTRSNYLSFFEIKVKKDGGLVEKTTGDFYTMNFSNNNDISFAAQGLELKAVVNKVAEWTGKNGVYIVAHSMGGLATRSYLQYFNDDKVKGLITMGTPHKGSRNDMLGSLGSAIVSGDVTEQLEQNSVDLDMLNKDCPSLSEKCSLPGNIKYFFIVVRGDGFWGKYSDDEGDGVVPFYSQWIEKGIGEEKTDPEVIIEGKVQVHTDEPGNSDIETKVWNKLIEWSN